MTAQRTITAAAALSVALLTACGSEPGPVGYDGPTGTLNIAYAPSCSASDHAIHYGNTEVAALVLNARWTMRERRGRSRRR